MYTVLIKYVHRNIEVIKHADVVEFYGEGSEDPGPGLLLVRHHSEEDCRSEHIARSTDKEDARNVYVMNASGATVATYYL